MSDPHSILAFDTGPLRHFAIQGWLGVLKFVTRDKTVVIPESVERELPEHRHEYPSLAQVFDADWIQVDRSLEIAYLTAFARLKEGSSAEPRISANVVSWRWESRVTAPW